MLDTFLKISNCHVFQKPQREAWGEWPIGAIYSRTARMKEDARTHAEGRFKPSELDIVGHQNRVGRKRRRNLLKTLDSRTKMVVPRVRGRWVWVTCRAALSRGPCRARRPQRRSRCR